MSFFSSVSWKSLTFSGGFPRLAAVVGCRGVEPLTLFFSQTRLACSPHTFPSQSSTLRPEDNGGGGAVMLVGALIVTNGEFVQGEPAENYLI